MIFFESDGCVRSKRSSASKDWHRIISTYSGNHVVGQVNARMIKMVLESLVIFISGYGLRNQAATLDDFLVLHCNYVLHLSFRQQKKAGHYVAA